VAVSSAKSEHKTTFSALRKALPLRSGIGISAGAVHGSTQSHKDVIKKNLIVQLSSNALLSSRRQQQEQKLGKPLRLHLHTAKRLNSTWSAQPTLIETNSREFARAKVALKPACRTPRSPPPTQRKRPPQ
jgi:hypothetical protein